MKAGLLILHGAYFKSYSLRREEQTDPGIDGSSLHHQRTGPDHVPDSFNPGEAGSQVSRCPRHLQTSDAWQCSFSSDDVLPQNKLLTSEDLSEGGLFPS